MAINFGDDKTFIENYQKLKSSRKMGELYHCDKASILNHAKKIGYDVSNNKEIKITNEDAEKIYSLYQELGSCKAVGKLYNCSDTAVRNYLIKSGYKLNQPGKLVSISDEDFIQLYDELKSAKLVAEKLNCSDTAVLNKAHKIGYDPLSNKTYKLTDEQKQIILNSYNTTTSNELAERFNVSRGMITKLWYDAGYLNKKLISIKTTEIDLTGKKFGKWTVLYKTDRRSASGGIKWHCRCECGIERDVDGLALRNGSSVSCGAHANVSSGNEKIKNILLQENIPFELEKKFPTCKDINPLPFDFFVNNQYLIEYDGQQHFDKDSLYNYEYTHKHDLIKDQWCKENNIPLIRIPYTHFKNLCLEDLLLETSTFIVK